MEENKNSSTLDGPNYINNGWTIEQDWEQTVLEKNLSRFLPRQHYTEWSGVECVCYLHIHTRCRDILYTKYWLHILKDYISEV